MAAEDPTFQPKALLSRPDLWSHLALVSSAFSVLSSDRPLGTLGGAGPIPFSAIDRYARRYEIDDLEAFERFLALIRVQDRVYLQHLADKSEKPPGK